MSTINRRNFARQLLLAAVGTQLVDLDRLLWVPKAMVTVPGMPVRRAIIALALEPYSYIVAKTGAQLSSADPVSVGRDGTVKRALKTEHVVGHFLGWEDE